jgi:hypothetical protein
MGKLLPRSGDLFRGGAISPHHSSSSSSEATASSEGWESDFDSSDNDEEAGDYIM